MGRSESGGVRYTIGELASRTGLTVKAIRFYADRGIVPPTDRSPAGHRQYSPEARARLELVRELRALGMDLRTVHKILTQETPLAEAAEKQAEAIAEQIRTLQAQHAALKSLATVVSFAATLDLAPGVAVTLTPQLPATPSAAQLEAWLELAILAEDKDFQARMRRIAGYYRDQPLRPDAAAMVRDQADLDLAPDSAEAVAIATRIVKAHGPRRELVAKLEILNDARRDRYMELVATVNGWPRPDPLGPALTWFMAAMKE
ncbi:MerR family transcriptional regulator [Kibdelosporangium philippinense]|uniref:MerR family transcriptional regulator n=1 Tax=Kibdelosporangium philippinense TaxID=211113 RepID=A0ABS8ZEH8_9PSEU|nr:MerR family transcriptional regulator [Kibdelosporangium philippinense]MCE7005957.1 MerR family transcriptional regulator [Kibdelosporangium philippinense]